MKTRFSWHSDFMISLYLLVVASIPRVLYLDSVIPGIHGDEGWTGLDARYILNHGLISPYSEHALGQPTGPLYITAFIFKLLGDSVYTLRLSMTLYGIITIPLVYIFLRLYFNKYISFITSIALSFSLMHLHYSRIALMLISAPVFVVTSLLFLIKAKRSKLTIYFILSAIFTGLGMYSYNSYLIYPSVPFIAIVFYSVENKFSKQSLKQSLLFIITFLLVSLPLIRIMISDSNFYFAHHRLNSITNRDDIKYEKNIIKKTSLIISNGYNQITQFTFGGYVDFADGFGKYYNFNISYLFIILLGICISAFNHKKKDLFFVFSLLILISSLVLTYDAVYRRPIIALVFIYYFFAQGVSFLASVIQQKYKFYLYTIISVVILFESVLNIKLYFFSLPKEETTKYVFSYELFQVANQIKDISNDKGYIMYSGRWSCHYEVLRYMLSDRKCSDISIRFGGSGTLPTKLQKDSIIVLLDPYLQDSDILRKTYPNSSRYYLYDNFSKKINAIVFKI